MERTLLLQITHAWLLEHRWACTHNTHANGVGIQETCTVGCGVVVQFTSVHACCLTPPVWRLFGTSLALCRPQKPDALHSATDARTSSTLSLFTRTPHEGSESSSVKVLVAAKLSDWWVECNTRT